LNGNNETSWVQLIIPVIGAVVGGAGAGTVSESIFGSASDVFVYFGVLGGLVGGWLLLAGFCE
jgi:hypothetical protein